MFDDWFKSKIYFLKKLKKLFLICVARPYGVCYWFTWHTSDLENLINAADLLKNDKVSFLMVGKGNLKPQLVQLVKSKNLTNISIIAAAFLISDT